MSMNALITRLEEGAGSDVEKVLAATKDAYSRRAYGEKAWKAAAEFLVKQYGAADAAKIMHHKAMRWAQDQAKSRDVKGIVASVKSTVGTWPAKEIVAEIGDSVELDEGKTYKDRPDYWRTVRGQHIGFKGSEGKGRAVIGPKEIVSRIKSKMKAMEEAKSVDTPNLDNYLKMQIFRDKFDKNTASGRIAIFDQVDNDLSPENITWDGERPASEVRKAAKFLNKVMQELLMLDPSLKSR